MLSGHIELFNERLLCNPSLLSGISDAFAQRFIINRHGWLSANLTDELTRACGSVAAFEDKYEFDAAHIFGGPSTFNKEEIQKLRDVGEEITPETLLDIPFMPVDRMEDYENVRNALAFHKQRGRFCYVQTPGFFEQFNDPLGI